MNKPLLSPLKGALQFIRNTFGEPTVIRLEKELNGVNIELSEFKQENERMMSLQDDNVRLMRENRLLRACNEGQTSFFGDRIKGLRKRIETQDKELTALKSIIDGLRKQNRDAGQKFYNPKDHSAPTVWICAKWGDWYMVMIQGNTAPHILSRPVFDEAYRDYEVIPPMTANFKALKQW